MSATFRRSRSFFWTAASQSRGLTTTKSACNEERTIKPFNAIPGPVQVPLLGNSLELRRNIERLRLYIHECFDKYGDIFKLKSIGSNYIVAVKDPSIMESVLRVEGKYPLRDTIFTPKFAWLFNNRGKEPLTFPFETGERWKTIRTAIGKQILPRNVQRYHPSFSNIIDRFKDHIKATREEDGTVKDIVPPLRRLLVELSAKTFYGNDWDVVANPTDEDQEFIEAVAFFIGSIVKVMAEFPWYRIYPDKFSRDFRQALQVMQKRSIAEAEKIYEQVAAGKTNEVPGLLEQWLREGKMSEKDAIYEAAGLFSTAIDSTSNQAVFLLHDMAIHQEVQEKLYEEIQTVLGKDELPSHQHLSQMPYMKGCLQECYRLNGTSAGNLRVVKEDTIILGYRIPANTTIAYSIYSAGRDSSLFHNPLKFDPERWQRDAIHPYAVQAFGVGPRSCYGKRFAELELKLLLIQMIKNFEVSTDLQEMETVHRSVVYPKGEVPMKFIDRN